ncbi:MAG TPA: PD-(D/E)XK nuclease family protein [Candidatus Baltobacteraceae bacterium]|nr:PD-(D/E)XK nuclease family protein [Candidatus Baltobacteraceae bacterium]
MLRSPLSGVPSGIAGAYATLSERAHSLVDLIAREALPCGMHEREALLAFASNLRDESAGEQPETLPPQEHSSPQKFALADPVQPEPATGVRTHNPRFSASQLNTYVECARKWYYRYLCAAIEDRGSSASFYGTAFHAALEDFHAEFPQPGAVDPEQLDRRLEGYVNAAFDRHRNFFDTPVEYELQRRRAQRTARKYVEWLVAQAKSAPFTVVGCELSAALQIDGYDFIGYIDRLDRDDRTGAVTVIDYKTGSIALSAAEYREKVRQFKDFQLPFYYWARTEAGDRVSRLALVPLKDALLDVRPIALEVVPVPAEIARSKSATGVIPIGELERARERMLQLCAELTSGTTGTFAVTDDPAACVYCVYNTACANRPYPEEERFAR